MTKHIDPIAAKINAAFAVLRKAGYRTYRDVRAGATLPSHDCVGFTRAQGNHAYNEGVLFLSYNTADASGYDAIAAAGARAIDVLTAAGFSCDRLSPGGCLRLVVR